MLCTRQWSMCIRPPIHVSDAGFTRDAQDHTGYQSTCRPFSLRRGHGRWGGHINSARTVGDHRFKVCIKNRWREDDFLLWLQVVVVGRLFPFLFHVLARPTSCIPVNVERKGKAGLFPSFTESFLLGGSVRVCRKPLSLQTLSCVCASVFSIIFTVKTLQNRSGPTLNTTQTRNGKTPKKTATAQRAEHSRVHPSRTRHRAAAAAPPTTPTALGRRLIRALLPLSRVCWLDAGTRAPGRDGQAGLMVAQRGVRQLHPLTQPLRG